MRGSIGTSWSERKVTNPQRPSRPSLSGLFSNMDGSEEPVDGERSVGSLRSNPVFEIDEQGDCLSPTTSAN